MQSEYYVNREIIIVRDEKINHRIWPKINWTKQFFEFFKYFLLENLKRVQFCFNLKLKKKVNPNQIISIWMIKPNHLKKNLLKTKGML